ncbi:MAG: NAD-dependent succinate-semialdehyde dehydrogenase [Tepidisphaeraceae bacterium]|jgi:succinate-semialdehyde dehydrogenase/glutarate-semialdehyde dehydrogenase
MRAINPATEETVAEYPEHTWPQIEQACAATRSAFALWRNTPLEQRCRLMRQAAALLRQRRSELAKLMTCEMGKPITAGEAEVDKCAAACDYFAQNATKFLAPLEIASDASRSYVRFEPLGPILAIMPWNFPLWQVFRFAAAALVAGNVVLLKHAPNVPGCALAIERLAAEAGFPRGVLAALLVSDNAVAEQIVSHPAIAAVTLTGSERAGSAVAAAAGRALKKTVMELGGSDPFIVLADADVPSVAAAAAQARCINNGQSCIAAKRFIVEAPIAEEFESALAAAMSAMKVGDPLDRATQIGPLARLDLLENLHRQVQTSIDQGARLLCGGRRLPGKGFFYQPTVLADVHPGMAAFDEETFGPVAAVTRAVDVDDAIHLANESRYGLGVSLWTKNVDRAQALAARLDGGCVFINGMVQSDPRLPFGGIKSSGWGRELSEFGMREFVNIKTVWVR